MLVTNPDIQVGYLHILPLGLFEKKPGEEIPARRFSDSLLSVLRSREQE
jgi:hypothetical protein